MRPNSSNPSSATSGRRSICIASAFTALELLKGPQFESLFPGTGKGAIDADIAWLRWHSSPEDLASTKKLVKNIPDDLAHVLDRMLKKRVADRPQSAQEVLKELADRPLIAVPMAGVEGAGEGAVGDHPMAPGVVRTISAPQTFAPRGASPAVNVGDATPQRQASGKAARPTKSSGAKAKPAPPRFSKDWFNQQLGRPYVLYPLCAVILLGALWISFGNPFGGGTTASAGKPPSPSGIPTMPPPPLIPVTFEVQPDAKGMEVTSGGVRVPANAEGKFEFPGGHFSLTFTKEGFAPVSREVDISKTNNKFGVKFEPIIKYVDVVVQVTPAEAELKVAGAKQNLVNGAYTHKLQEGQPLSLKPISISTRRSRVRSRPMSSKRLATR